MLHKQRSMATDRRNRILPPADTTASTMARYLGISRACARLPEDMGLINCRLEMLMVAQLSVDNPTASMPGATGYILDERYVPMYLGSGDLKHVISGPSVISRVALQIMEPIHHRFGWHATCISLHRKSRDTIRSVAAEVRSSCAFGGAFGSTDCT